MATGEHRELAAAAWRFHDALHVAAAGAVLAGAVAAFAWYGVARPAHATPGYLSSQLANSLEHHDHDAFVRALASLPSIDKVDDHGITPLMVAVSYGDAAETEYILAHGADPNRCHYGRGTPLITAVGDGHSEAAGVLLRYGADPGQVTNLGDTALLAAVRSGGLECVRLLLASGANPMPAGIRQNPLSWAVARGDEGLEVLRLLLASGIDPNRAGADGELPIVAATLYRSARCVELLRAAGADPDLPDGNGHTARGTAAGDPPLVAALRAQG
jgi:ankyrin repeat protein